MTTSSDIHDLSLGLGLTSLVLGVVGLLLFALPILSIPLGIAGLVFGVGGLLRALPDGWARLRWPVAGIALAGLALAASLAIDQAPSAYMPIRAIPLDTQAMPDRPYVPPPARPGTLFEASSPNSASLR